MRKVYNDKANVVSGGSGYVYERHDFSEDGSDLLDYQNYRC